MTSQNEKQTITENILLNISSGKDSQAMRFSQFIEYNTKSGCKTSPRLFSKVKIEHISECPT